ncbi:MAG: hypothetical protein FJW36_26320 [Acidobacteria bacterium]|nr:hypothetical protein [Acidobacteriota bacterium]
MRPVINAYTKLKEVEPVVDVELFRAASTALAGAERDLNAYLDILRRAIQSSGGGKVAPPSVVAELDRQNGLALENFRSAMNSVKSLLPKPEADAPRVNPSAAHVAVAKPILQLSLWLTAILGVLCIAAGVLAIVSNSVSPSEINIVGMTIKTGHVGVALSGLGVVPKSETRD